MEKLACPPEGSLILVTSMETGLRHRKRQKGDGGNSMLGVAVMFLQFSEMINRIWVIWVEFVLLFLSIYHIAIYCNSMNILDVRKILGLKS